MLPDRVSNPGPLTYESGALPIALRGPAIERMTGMGNRVGMYDEVTNQNNGSQTLLSLVLISQTFLSKNSFDNFPEIS